MHSIEYKSERGDAIVTEDGACYLVCSVTAFCYIALSLHWIGNTEELLATDSVTQLRLDIPHKRFRLGNNGRIMPYCRGGMRIGVYVNFDWATQSWLVDQLDPNCTRKARTINGVATEPVRSSFTAVSKKFDSFDPPVHMSQARSLSSIHNVTDGRPTPDSTISTVDDPMDLARPAPVWTMEPTDSVSSRASEVLLPPVPIRCTVNHHHGSSQDTAREGVSREAVVREAVARATAPAQEQPHMPSYIDSVTGSHGHHTRHHVAQVVETPHARQAHSLTPSSLPSTPPLTGAHISPSTTDHVPVTHQLVAPSTDLTISKLKRHSCNQCPKAFKRKDHLSMHMFVHSAERPFKCTTCTKGFKRKDYLVKHQQRCVRDSPV